ncbi:MAG: recombination regulator RecX [Gallionellales bacterium CG_4_10_14_3_um_filter_54_96]|nr:MAG: recombination regulator RecX [Gallionellaceae bacterium CG1_02_56_997]PIV14386.1 MAG: recombination regulator RecX [Gallionellales bacterium CG03_land_8_20_14_0_80_55_15]PIV91403.1 MAG: recombination regulator RecX [Gallionellales bacterium CG17_big_fil_post_rev_8_21_14_2_50_54_146]PIX04537.1 MAG: recombination regulator RecX [Gallionellales bacterium CG_4_8_14_3_um_filter_54_18]PIY03415.1 MAG: recombination regulator RecX [Gallionellales bacterium CG_4_10_14_3_um_filter_54_96]PJC03562
MREKPELTLRTRALQYLARREYSRAELRGKLLAQLQKQSMPPDDGGFEQLADDAPSSDWEVSLHELDALLDDLIERGWLSDRRAATQLLHARRGRFGTQRITHELRQKGIPLELIEQALPGLQDSELAAARSVWQRKFGKPPQDGKEKARQMRFLQSRGFGFDVIFKVLHSELE